MSHLDYLWVTSKSNVGAFHWCFYTFSTRRVAAGIVKFPFRKRMIETVAARLLTSPRRDAWLRKTTSPLVHLNYGREKPKEFPEFPILDRVCFYLL